MLRSRSWFGTNWSRPKNRLSLDYLKYLFNILEKNGMVSESNQNLLVESLRCIAEILIWGDQHDSSVFDFFLEKNMLSYFLHIMRQKNGGSNFVCVQLLQTLNILFENIRNETSLYYLLSNNHVNSIIVYKFDFLDEDVMGYYILFLKTLSLKLNVHTIHFFYNENTNDFPLYTEAIKFFNHSESMVRIAVRTITLNVYKIENSSMLKFIRDKTAASYFNNLVWFIGKQIMDLDLCVKNCVDEQFHHKLSNLVAEHLDHLHYLNDILLLKIKDLNAVLTAHLLNKLFVPLYICSLRSTDESFEKFEKKLTLRFNKNENVCFDLERSRISVVVSFYLISLVFLVITHTPLIHKLANILLNTNYKLLTDEALELLKVPCEKSSTGSPYMLNLKEEQPKLTFNSQQSCVQKIQLNITDEEKQKIKAATNGRNLNANNFSYLELILSSLSCEEDDYFVLMGLLFLYSLINSKGGSRKLLEDALHTKDEMLSIDYKTILTEKLLKIITLAVKSTSSIRLISLEITLNLFLYLSKLQADNSNSNQFKTLLSAKHESMKLVANSYKSEDSFLELFENEYYEMNILRLNAEFLCMDPSILIPPTISYFPEVQFCRRLPHNNIEKVKKDIRTFLLLRKTCQGYLNETENLLPLFQNSNYVETNNILDLNNRDLISCTVISKANTKQKRFLVIDTLQFSLVEPDAKRLGWGVVKFVGFLQNVEVSNDKEDSRSLYITVNYGKINFNKMPKLDVKFEFDDHIRCMAAKQRLIKGRSKACQKKMFQIAQILEIPIQGVEPDIYNKIEKEGVRKKLIFPFSGPGFAAALSQNAENSKLSPKSNQLTHKNISRSADIPLATIKPTVDLNLSLNLKESNQQKSNEFELIHQPLSEIENQNSNGGSYKSSGETSFIARKIIDKNIDNM